MTIWIFSRNFIIVLTVTVLAVMGSVSCCYKDRQKPNTVLFYADDLDFDESTSYDSTVFPSYTAAWESGHYRIQKDGWFVQNNRRLPRCEHGFYSDKQMLTLNIEKLANQGVIFSRYYATSSLCTRRRTSGHVRFIPAEISLPFIL